MALLLLPLPAVAGEWVLEAEEGGRVEWLRDSVADIHAPGGLTLWNRRLMRGDVTIEYEARIVGDARVSDLNCFWMASDPEAKSVFTRMKERGGKFVNTYTMRLYYVGYGGNHNSTTRFRRYTGDARGVENAAFRPPVLREYLDSAHMIKPDHWYHIRLESIGGRVRYFIDGECLVDYSDPRPLTEGYFGFRTTLAHAQLRNFRMRNVKDGAIVVRRICGDGREGCVRPTPTTFGVPFSQGEKRDAAFSLTTPDGTPLAFDTWRLASWPDGSTKWQAFATVVPGGCDSIFVSAEAEKRKAKPLSSNNSASSTHTPAFYLTLNNQVQPILSHDIEREGGVLTVHKYTTRNFLVRTYHYAGSDDVRMVHTLFVDSALNRDGLREAGVHFRVPMHGDAYERYVAFDGNRPMSVQPLIARRPINIAALQNRDSASSALDPVSRRMVEQIAKWDGFRLSQLSSEGYTIRKRATSRSPWIGTKDGRRSEGIVTIGDSTAVHTFRLKDFWQSYPSTLQVDNARGDTALVTVSLYSPEAEPFSFEHYDTISHGLDAAYEDVQPGMSTAWGIARTSEIFIRNAECGMQNDRGTEIPHTAFSVTPEYLHRKRAFGYWSLDKGTMLDTILCNIRDFYAQEQERNSWYGYFNYGDVMHSYDASRDEWRYDVGGYAWDNTELGTPAMLWYEFLRTGDAKTFRMAEAMTRHCAEVDCYHRGPHAGLGTRHNVLHWGCGAKEARISQAFWNRFLYYLTADDRMGDLLSEVRDADTLLYRLDPMRLAQPRSEKYPCTAPARLRIGPDWLAYAGNWFTEWERTGNTAYRDKILAGMRSIAALPHGMFSGPKALGYDPATGIITWEGDTAVQNTNHLATIMGGFEMMNEMMMSLTTPEWDTAWLRHSIDYKEKALAISRNKFRIPRLNAYAYWLTGAQKVRDTAVSDLLKGNPFRNLAVPNFRNLNGGNDTHNGIVPAPPSVFYTNDAATFTLDAIFMQEVMPDQ